MSSPWDDYAPTPTDAALPANNAAPQPATGAPLTYATAGIGDIYTSGDGRSYRKMLSPYANDGTTTIGVLQTPSGEHAAHPNVSTPHFMADPLTITATPQAAGPITQTPVAGPDVVITQPPPQSLALTTDTGPSPSDPTPPAAASTTPAASPWADYEPPSSQAASAGRQVAAGAAETLAGQLNSAFQMSPAVALGRLQNWLADKFNVPLKTSLPQTADAANVVLPQAGSAIAPPPSTALEGYARTGGQFLPAIAAPGNAAARVANVILPTLGSEALGRLTKGSRFEAPARIAGAMLGGIVAPGAGGIQARLTAPRPLIPASLDEARGGLGALGIHSLPDPGALGAKIAARANPVDAAIQQTASELPVPVRMSRGQITGDPSQQLMENLTLRGGRGQPAADVARGFQREQQGDLRANLGEIASRLGRGQGFGYGHGGAVVSDELNAIRSAKSAAVTDAYDAARGAESPAYLGPQDSRAMVSNVRNSVADYDPLNIPRVSREIDRLHATMLPTEGPDVLTPSQTTAADVRGMFASRSRLTNLRTSNDPVEASAAKKAVQALDASIEEAVSRDLFKGDADTVGLWKKAVGERREFGQLFESNDLVHALTERQFRGGSYSLKVDPNDASNQILGRSNLGYVGRRNLYRDLGRLKEVLGSESSGWNAVRAEVFQRMAGVGEGGIEGGTQQFSGAKFQKAWNEAKTKDPRLVEALFSPDDRDLIDKFSAISARVTNAVKGGDNASNTAVATRAIRLFRRLPFVAIESIPLIDHFAEKIDNAVSVAAIKKATYGAQPRKIAVPNAPTLPDVGRSAALAAILARGAGRPELPKPR